MNDMTDLLARLRAALAADDDHMVASGDRLIWLAAQLACYPARVDPAKTTNDRYLRMSAAATLQHQAARIEAMAGEIEGLRSDLAWEKAQSNVFREQLGIPRTALTAHSTKDIRDETTG